MSQYIQLPDGSHAEQVSLVGSKVTEGIADLRLNTQGILLASAVRNAQTISPTQTNYNARGIIIFLEVTAISGTGIRPHIRGFSPQNSSYWLNPAPALITANGVYGYELYPGISGTTPGIVQATSGALPRSWAVEIEHTDASSVTYSVGYALIL